MTSDRGGKVILPAANENHASVWCHSWSTFTGTMKPVEAGIDRLACLPGEDKVLTSHPCLMAAQWRLSSAPFCPGSSLGLSFANGSFDHASGHQVRPGSTGRGCDPSMALQICWSSGLLGELSRGRIMRDYCASNFSRPGGQVNCQYYTSCA